MRARADPTSVARLATLAEAFGATAADGPGDVSRDDEGANANATRDEDDDDDDEEDRWASPAASFMDDLCGSEREGFLDEEEASFREVRDVARAEAKRDAAAAEDEDEDEDEDEGSVTSLSLSLSLSLLARSPAPHSPTYAPEASNRAILEAQYPSATQKELSSATATSVGMQNPSAPRPGLSFAPNAATRSPVSASYRITWCSPASTIHTSPSGPRVNP